MGITAKADGKSSLVAEATGKWEWEVAEAMLTWI